jgi:hypothetical protein
MPQRLARRHRNLIRFSVSPNAWSLHRAGPVLQVTVSESAGEPDFELLVHAILAEVVEGARDIVLGGPGMEHPTKTADAFVRVLLGHRRELEISVSLDPPKGSPS